jgi:hypothetical protein
MSIRDLFEQALNFLSDPISRNKVKHDLLWDAAAKALDGIEAIPKEAIVLKVFPGNSTGEDIDEGKKQYQSAILRIEYLHDSLPDPARIYRIGSIGATNKAIQAHGEYFSIEPLDSTDSAQNTSVLLKPGSIVPVEKINGAWRFGAPTGTHSDYLTFNPSQDPEDQLSMPTESELMKAFGRNHSALLEDMTGEEIAEDSLQAASSNPLLAGQVVTNGKLPPEAMTTIDGVFDRRGRPAMFLAEVADEFVLLMADFEEHFGYPLPLNDTYRSYDRQVKTKEKYGKKAAKAGTSKHGWGLAFDFNTKMTVDGEEISGFDSPRYKWMYENAPKRGFHSPPWAQKGGSNEEAWHFEAIGANEYIAIFGASDGIVEGD